MKIIYGPPGTGKTTYLLQRMEEELEAGVDPKRIAFVSFTTAAVKEALSRAKVRFGFIDRDLPYFKTLHALAFAEVGAQRSSVMSNYDEFARDTGMRIRSQSGVELMFNAHSPDDILLRAHQLSAAMMLPFEEVVRQQGLKASPERYETFLEKLADWKRASKKHEYADLLGDFIGQQRALPIEVAFVDEAQDLTPQQWRVVDQAFASAREVYVAGDDDQAIYRWAGADVERMLTLEGETLVLAKSHRLPAPIHRLTSSIGARILRRKAKVWSPADHKGLLEPSVALHALDLNESGSWMMLARTSYALRPFIELLESSGMMYRVNGISPLKDTDVEAYQTLATLRAGGAVRATTVKRMLMKGAWGDERMRLKNSEMVTRERLHEEALLHDDVVLRDVPAHALRFLRRVAARGEWTSRAEVSTIHQAKGAEADHVVLAPELSRATHSALRSPRHTDDEQRVWYVAVSRARRSLRIAKDSGEFNYRFA